MVQIQIKDAVPPLVGAEAEPDPLAKRDAKVIEVNDAAPPLASPEAEADPLAKRDGKVIEGKDGWLYLGRDRNDVISQVTGKFRLSGQALLRWQLVLEMRAAWIERLGGRYVMLVPPNSHAAYPEHLPDEVVMSEDRPVRQIEKALRERDSYARMVYPLEQLRAGHAVRHTYSLTDSHWNAWGAFLAYREAMAAIDDGSGRRVLDANDVEFTERVVVGDLGNKVEPRREAVQIGAKVRDAKARLVSDNRVRNNGRVVVYECEEASEGTCVVFGDSFSYATLRFFAESFRRLVFGHTVQVDADTVFQERPLAAINIMNERFLRQVPDDMAGRSLRKRAGLKKAAGDVLTQKSVDALAVKLAWP